MASGTDVRRPTPTPQVLRRRRAWTGAAVALCVLADVWTVSSAGAREQVDDGPVLRSSRVALAVGTAPAVTVDDVESAPAAGTDAQVGGESPTGSAGATNDGTGGGVQPGEDRQGTVVEVGSGRFTVVSVPASALRPPPTTGRTVRYTVELEGGLGIRAADLAKTVGAVLTDPRGWQTKDHVRFVNVSPAAAAQGAPVDLRISLASPTTTDRLCAPLETRGEVSCHNMGRVVLNLRRWVLGAAAYGTDVAAYRTYLVNHEVGHGIGHAHAYCSGKGAVAPVMMQQTYGLKGCTAWPWPTSKPA